MLALPETKLFECTCSSLSGQEKKPASSSSRPLVSCIADKHALPLDELVTILVDRVSFPNGAPCAICWRCNMPMLRSRLIGRLPLPTACILFRTYVYCRWYVLL